jgi:HD-like signal output (HDOD) protein
MSIWLLGSLMALAFLAVTALWWFRQPRAAAPQAGAVPRNSTSLVAPQRQAPAVLAMAPSFDWHTEERLDPARRDHLLAGIHGIPRPPHALQRLLEPEFMARASAAELRELVIGEPLIAARVLATVNSPLYGLQTPVTDIGQAVTYLGVASVRGLCLQHMLADSFPTRLPGVRKAFNALWTASAIASELAVRLDRMPGLPAAIPLNTQVVLGFVGRLATASLIPTTGLSAWLQRDRLARARLEQDLLGLSACEIGHLLMKSWSLPTELVADVRDGGRLLVVPPEASAGERLPRLALAGLCARLGERLALGQLTSLDGYRPADDDAPDVQHLRGALQHPALAGLDKALQAPELLRTVRQMLAPAVPA